VPCAKSKTNRPKSEKRNSKIEIGKWQVVSSQLHRTTNNEPQTTCGLQWSILNLKSALAPPTPLECGASGTALGQRGCAPLTVPGAKLPKSTAEAELPLFPGCATWGARSRGKPGRATPRRSWPGGSGRGLGPTPLGNDDDLHIVSQPGDLLNEIAAKNQRPRARLCS
jgi:hypothetical protein